MQASWEVQDGSLRHDVEDGLPRRDSRDGSLRHGTQDGSLRRTVSILVPLYDEEDVIGLLIEEIEAFRKKRPEVTEVIFVNDGSRDRTAEKVRRLTQGKPGYRLVGFSRNFGHQIAITAGIERVSTDAVVIMDADLQDPLYVAGQMIDRWREGYDVVYGIRGERDGVTWFRRTAMYLFYRFFDRMTDIDAPLDTGDFRLISREVIDAYKRFGERQPFVRGLIAWLGFQQIGIRYARPARAAGTSKYPFRKHWRLATSGITSFSDKPLRYAVSVGILLALVSVAGLVWVLMSKVVFGVETAGWASLIFVAFFFGGAQLFFLGIVGTYIARVYNEVKARPRYVVQDVWRSDWVSEPVGERAVEPVVE